MAYSDPISERQERWILKMAESAVSFYEGPEDLDVLVREVYGCNLSQMNRGQASMLIDDLLYELGESEAPPTHQSIFSRVPERFG